jgi:hypothetical protein
MKKLLLVLTLFVLLLVPQISAQSYSVWFTNPTNGSTICNTYSSTQVSIITTIGATGTPAQNHLNWKFILNTDNGSHTIYDTDTFEEILRGSGTYYWNVDMHEVFTNGQEVFVLGSTSNQYPQKTIVWKGK